MKKGDRQIDRPTDRPTDPYQCHHATRAPGTWTTSARWTPWPSCMGRRWTTASSAWSWTGATTRPGDTAAGRAAVRCVLPVLVLGGRKAPACACSAATCFRPSSLPHVADCSISPAPPRVTCQGPRREENRLRRRPGRLRARCHVPVGARARGGGAPGSGPRYVRVYEKREREGVEGTNDSHAPPPFTRIYTHTTTSNHTNTVSRRRPGEA